MADGGLCGWREVFNVRFGAYERTHGKRDKARRTALLKPSPNPSPNARAHSTSHRRWLSSARVEKRSHSGLKSSMCRTTTVHRHFRNRHDRMDHSTFKLSFKLRVLTWKNESKAADHGRSAQWSIERYDDDRGHA